MFESADPKQPFYVANQIAVSEENIKVLTTLFEPLVGIQGVGLYITLTNEFDEVPFAKDYKTLYQLQDQTNLKLEDLFSTLHHLEATGLVKTFLGSNPVLGEVLIFEVEKVPSAGEFFHTFLLSSLLLERVGNVAFNRLVKKFTPRTFVGLKDAKEVTSGFFDVFHLSAESAIDAPVEVKEAAGEVPKDNKSKIKLGNEPVKIDWNFLVDLFASYHIDKGEVLKHQVEIKQIIDFYHLTEQEFVDTALITMSAGSEKLNMYAIQNAVNENFGLNRNKKMVKKQLQQVPKDANRTIKKLSQSDADLLKAVDSKVPTDYLYELKEKKGGYVTANEKKVIFRLQDQMGLTPPLINMIVYACFEYDTVLTANLADRIANDWLQQGIATPAEAIVYLKERKNTRKRQYYRAPKKTVRKTTDWSKYEKQNQTKRKTMSTEERNRIFREFGKNE